jgi:hypothetical protein
MAGSFLSFVEQNRAAQRAMDGTRQRSGCGCLANRPAPSMFLVNRSNGDGTSACLSYMNSNAIAALRNTRIVRIGEARGVNAV